MACEEAIDDCNPICSPYSADVESRNIQPTAPETPLWRSSRLVVMISCFLSMLTNFSGQSLMTSAMVCMITSPTLTNDVNNTTNNTTTSSNQRNDWTFSWDSKIQNLILSSYFLFYTVGQLPSGILAQRKLLITGQAMSALSQVMTVPATQWGLSGILVARLVGGLANSLLYTNTMAILANWTPRPETSFVFGSVGMGMEAGNLLAFGFSMFACQIDVMAGWPFVFFFQGALQLFVMGMFVFCVQDNPSSQSSITPEERAYLLSTATQKKTWTNTPVRAIVTSLPVIALAISKVAALHAYFIFVVVAPQFARDVLKLPALFVSTVFSLPFLVSFPSIVAMGKISDHIVLKGIASNTTVRKALDFVNKFVYSALIIGLGYLPSQSWPLALVMNVAIVFSLGTGYLTYEANPADLSPAHTGFVSAFVQTCSYWVTVVTPLVVGVITQDTTRESWQRVFFIDAAIQVAAFSIYVIFGSGEIQPWALLEPCPEDAQETKEGITGGIARIASNNEACSSNDNNHSAIPPVSNETTPLNSKHKPRIKIPFI